MHKNTMIYINITEKQGIITYSTIKIMKSLSNYELSLEKINYTTYKKVIEEK